MQLQKKEHNCTYADYCTWDDGKRWELIEGVPYAMAPGPSQVHQSISGDLFVQLHNFLKGKPCKLFSAPFDVRLNADTGDDTVVQPDILVVCDQSKLDGKSCIGAPDFIVEITSPSSLRLDRLIKLLQYQRSGVREYWIVEPESKSVSVHLLENGKYTITAYGDDEIAPVHVLEGCTINLREVFDI